MVENKIVIRGARANNLKNIDVSIPKNSLTVMTGLSGSGKSSLAFETLYAEGQRRYVESLSAYARQFLGQMEKPDVDSIDGLSPAISIDQKTTNNNPRSTVGTVTEINDYLRLLFARVGRPEQKGDVEVLPTVDQIVEKILTLDEKSRIQIFAPIIQNQAGTHESSLKKAKKLGYVRVRIDDEISEFEELESLALEREKEHNVEIMIDRVVVNPESRSRIFDAVEAATKLADGQVFVEVLGDKTYKYSDHYLGDLKDFKVGRLEPRLFSFNAPLGACEYCQGLGVLREVDLDLLVPDDTLSISDGAIVAFNSSSNSYYLNMLVQFSEQNGIDPDVSWKKLTKKHKDLILYGSDKPFHFHSESDFGGVIDKNAPFEGVIPNIKRRFESSDFARESLGKYMSELTCNACGGYRLNPAALSVKIEGKHIGQISELAVGKEIEWFSKLKLKNNDLEIAQPIVKEISDRLGFLNSVGLNYLTLSRSAGTLSGGESQRIRLATQIGSNLSGVLYVLDEPSIGLHQRDNDMLLNSLRKMRDLGNTLVIVEHDEDTMNAADYLIDVGPGAGEQGGRIMAAGTPAQVKKNPKSITGKYLSGKKFIPVPSNRRTGNGEFIEIKGAAANNLKEVDVQFPLGEFVAVTGVSGSGKSSLVNTVLKRALKQKLNNNSEKPGRYSSIDGYQNIEKIIDINQQPIGRTPRSNPATYTGVFDDIRDLFAQTNEAKMRGYKKGRFSFNTKGGRCENCQGDGVIKIEMNFLPDVYVTCDVCSGTRYNSETLEVTYHDKNISDVLNMTVQEAIKFFEPIPKIYRKLKTISDVGLDYVRLGQSATTLSGGEAQRMKLASELHRLSTGKNFYILDEPTTGLHVDDISRLLEVLQRLVDAGNTVLVIEHNLDVIKTADWIIDMGPEGGEGGGTLLAEGTPEELIKVKKSYTGKYLKEIMERDLARAKS